MGLQLKIPGATFSSDKPVLNTIDDIQSSGSLVLFDVSHPDQNFTLLSSAASENVTNLVADTAATIVGTSAANCFIRQQRAETNSGSNFFETTTKGGIHVVSATSGQTGPNAWSILLDNGMNPLHDYIEANLSTNDLYISQWITLSRETSIVSVVQSHMHYASNTSNYAFYWQGSGTTPVIPGSPDEFDLDPTGFVTTSASFVGQNGRRAIKTNGYTGSFTGANKVVMGALGNTDAWQNFNFNSGLGIILYRTYIEDLTVSGRTFEEVNAIDERLHTAAFSEGGAFYGDTYSDPDVVRP